MLSARLTVDYPGKPGVLRDLSLDIQPGEIFGLVGESGAGKSTLALAILRLLYLKKATATGELRFAGHDLMKLSEAEARHVRGRELALVLQTPTSALNPALRIGTQLREAWKAHSNGQECNLDEKLASLLQSVTLPGDKSFLRRYPAQISVGQAQRVLIAMAIIHRPKLLIADEPGSALDAITNSEILKLFSQLNREMGMAILYISHDLLSIASLCHRIAILQNGGIVECGTPEKLFQQPEHPYTRSLIAALPHSPLENRGVRAANSAK